MRGRTRFTVGLALVLTTAVVSTAVAARQEHSTDDQLRKAALAGVYLSVIAPQDAPTPFDQGQPDGKTFAVPVRNDGTANVEVRRATWRGGLSREVNQLLTPGGSAFVSLTQPTTCPTRRSRELIDHIEVEVGVADGSRTVRLALLDPLQPSVELNQRCGLFRARESLQASTQPVRSRPHEVTLDVSVEFLGPRSTQLLAVRATEGVTVAVTEPLPLTLHRAPTSVGNSNVIPHSFTVTLRLTDCAGPRRRQQEEEPGDGEYRLPPTYGNLQLTVQHPGDEVEKVNLSLGIAPANALVAGCGLPPLVENYGG